MHLSDDDFAAFVGESSEYYLSKWKGLNTGSAKLAGMNWAVFVFGPLWYFYRRLYGLGALVFVLGFVSQIIGEVVSYSVFDEGFPHTLIGFVFLFAFIRLPFGMYANISYFKRAKTTIATANESDSREELIRHGGGTSELAMWGFLVFFVVMQFLLVGLAYAA